MSELARTKFANLGCAGKQAFLAYLGLHLTISGRAFTLESDRQRALAALAGLNELQHRLMAQIAALGLDAERYPDDVFWATLYETATNHSIDSVLAEAIEFAASRSN